MNRYSRINSKSKSSVPIEFSDHVSLPISQTPSKISKPHEEKFNKDEFSEKSIHINGSIQDQETNGEMFGVILSRSRSVSSYKSMTEKERSCSMKRSSSASSAAGGGYCRIHHQNDYPISDEETENLNVLHRRQRKKEKGKILRACMKIAGILGTWN